MYKVLIVEDEDIIRKSLLTSMDWASLQCTVVASSGSGLEALSMIERHQPQIIITDIFLPDLDGLELLKQAKKICDFESIIITGYNQFEYARDAILLSTVDFILKPIDESRLADSIRVAGKRIEEKEEVRRLRNETDAVGVSYLRDDSSFLDSFIESSRGDLQLERALFIIRSKYIDQLSIENLSFDVGISQGHLSRKLKSFTDMSFTELLNRRRLEQALRILENQNSQRFYEVAERSGFSSYKRFYEVFIQFIGISPGEYIRNKIIKDEKGGVE